MTTKRTRGPRTAYERAGDVARRAATSFEDLPANLHSRDLKTMAVLLRTWFGSQSEKRAKDAEQASHSLLREVRRWARDFRVSTHSGVTNDDLLMEFDDLCREIQDRARNYVDLAAGSREALDEGLVFASKAEELLKEARYGSKGDSFSGVSYAQSDLAKMATAATVGAGVGDG